MQLSHSYALYFRDYQRDFNGRQRLKGKKIFFIQYTDGFYEPGYFLLIFFHERLVVKK